jgi:hypothetical protein
MNEAMRQAKHRMSAVNPTPCYRFGVAPMRGVLLLVLLELAGGCVDHLAAPQAYLNRFVGRSEVMGGATDGRADAQLCDGRYEISRL